MTTLELAFATGFFCAAFSVCPVAMLVLLSQTKPEPPKPLRRGGWY